MHHEGKSMRNLFLSSHRSSYFSEFSFTMHRIFYFWVNGNMNDFSNKKWYFVTKTVLTYCEKNCSSDREKLLKFKAEGREFAKILRSLEQFIRTVKCQNNV